MVDSSGTAQAIGRLPYRAARAGLSMLQRRWRRHPLAERTILFESFAGSSFSCNPLALYRHVVRDPRFADFSFIWSVSDAALVRSVRPTVEGDRRTDYVRHRSWEYFRALATAKYLVNNVTFPVSFAKRPDQIYLNTWHGTPLKKMGRDVPGADLEVLGDTIANLRAADFLLSQSPYMTDTMYAGAYGLGAEYSGRILQLGYPRVDAQFDRQAQGRARAELTTAGVDVAGRRVLVYAPTWRQADAVRAADDTDRLADTVTALQRALPATHWLVLLRVHDKALPFVSARADLAPFLVPASIGTNALLGLADTLVTDYSSVFFDYLATGTSVLFYTPDRDRYAAERGLYLADDELPGPLTDSIDELVSWLREGAAEHGHATAAAARARFCPWDDGGATARVVAEVFG